MNPIGAMLLHMMLAMVNVAVGTWLGTWMALRKESRALGWFFVVLNAVAAAYNVALAVMEVTK